MALGGVVGFVAGAMIRLVLLKIVGGILAQFDNSIKTMTMGDIPIWVEGPITLLAWGLTIFGAVKGYRMGVRQALNTENP